MTNANMKLVVVKVEAESIDELPLQELDDGEFITRRVVALKDLSKEIKGLRFCDYNLQIGADNIDTAYEAKGFVVDARLAHFAIGYDLALSPHT